MAATVTVVVSSVPTWVTAVNAGTILPLTDASVRRLDVADLLAEARARQGVDDTADLGPGDFREPFAVAVAALEDEAELTPLGRFMTRLHLVRLIEVRLQISRYVRDDPGVLDERIVEPLFLVGAPRTGTTILHSLLAQDPGLRAPFGWELLRPVPPPLPETHRDDARIALADLELVLPQSVSGALVSIHEYGGRMLKECISAMSLSFRTEEFISRYDTPSYRAWHFSCDMTPAYEMHKVVLQILQRRFPTRRWVLKSPVHLHSLPTLLAVYPDAKLVVTHRDPLTLLGSVTSLVATLRGAFSDRVDRPAIGRYHADLYHGDLDGLVDLVDDGTLDPPRIVHTQYEDFMADPLGPVRQVYAHFGWELPPSTEAAMLDHLASRPQDKHGSHGYSFDDLGLDRRAEAARYRRYGERFGVQVGP